MLTHQPAQQAEQLVLTSNGRNIDVMQANNFVKENMTRNRGLISHHTMNATTNKRF